MFSQTQLPLYNVSLRTHSSIIWSLPLFYIYFSTQGTRTLKKKQVLSLINQSTKFEEHKGSLNILWFPQSCLWGFVYHDLIILFDIHFLSLAHHNFWHRHCVQDIFLYGMLWGMWTIKILYWWSIDSVSLENFQKQTILVLECKAKDITRSTETAWSPVLQCESPDTQLPISLDRLRMISVIHDWLQFLDCLNLWFIWA